MAIPVNPVLSVSLLTGYVGEPGYASHVVRRSLGCGEGWVWNASPLLLSGGLGWANPSPTDQESGSPQYLISVLTWPCISLIPSSSPSIKPSSSSSLKKPKSSLI